MGLRTKRRANRATHVVAFGDGLCTLACKRHAEQFTRRPPAFAYEIRNLSGFMCAEASDAELRDALQLATYERRAELRDLAARFETVRRRDIDAAVQKILARGLSRAGADPPSEHEDRPPELDTPRVEDAS